MDLQKIRELAAQVNRDRTPEDAMLAAEQLNNAADEIERVTKEGKRTADALARSDKVYAESVAGFYAEIATLRSMVPTLRDGDAKVTTKTPGTCSMHITVNLNGVAVDDPDIVQRVERAVRRVMENEIEVLRKDREDFAEALRQNDGEDPFYLCDEMRARIAEVKPCE